MPMQELIDVISKTNDPVLLNHAVDKFFTYFHYIQRRCGADIYSDEERIEAFLQLLPNDIELLQLIRYHLEPISAYNPLLASISIAAEVKIEMLSPNYREPNSKIAAEIIAAHNITHNSIISNDLKNLMREEINNKCIERTKAISAFEQQEPDKQVYSIDNIMHTIKLQHKTMMTVHHFINPAEKKLFTLYQLTNALTRHLHEELDNTISKALPEMNLKILFERCKKTETKEETSLSDEIKKLSLPKNTQSKINPLIDKLDALDNIRKAFDERDPSNVASHYQKLFNNAKPLLMKNADSITKRLLHWIGLKLNIKRFQNQAIVRYTELENYATIHLLLLTRAAPQTPQADEKHTPKNKK